MHTHIRRKRSIEDTTTASRHWEVYKDQRAEPQQKVKAFNGFSIAVAFRARHRRYGTGKSYLNIGIPEWPVIRSQSF
jgi:hypothetical protein